MSFKIAILITSHNRKNSTMAAIAAVQCQQLPVDTDCTVFLLDDNSSDGTPTAIQKQYPAVRLFHGDGNRFWNGGMRLVYAAALKEDFDYYVFLNDDVELSVDALRRLLETSAELIRSGNSKAIIIGSMRDAENGKFTYGGVVRSNRMRAMTFRQVIPGFERKRCDTFNANLVLIPREVANVLGNLSAEFQHSMGDFDYGLRAWKRGCSVWVAPGYFGNCARNRAGKAYDHTLRFRQRWSAFCGVKGLPPKEWYVLTRRHAGLFWPIYFVSPYVRFLVKVLLREKADRATQMLSFVGQKPSSSQR